MASKADNTEFSIIIVDKFITILKKYVSKEKTVQKGSFIEKYGIGQGEGIEKFKSGMLKIFSGNIPLPKDGSHDIFTVDDVLRYYETINLDIEGSKKILKTFDSVDRGFKVPSPSAEAIAAATAETEGVSNVVPSGTAGNLVQGLNKKIAEEGEEEEGEGDEPVPSPAPAPMPPPQEPVPPQGPRPQPGEQDIQENVVSGGGKKKRTHNKKKRRSKKKAPPLKRRNKI